MFKTMTALLQNKYPSQEKIKKIPSFIMLRWLSNNPYTVIPANMMNINYNIPIENQFRFLDDYFTLTKIKQKVRFIKYNKKEDKQLEIIENIKKYYNVNNETATNYYSILTKSKTPESLKEIQRFQDMYKEGKVWQPKSKPESKPESKLKF